MTHYVVARHAPDDEPMFPRDGMTVPVAVTPTYRDAYRYVVLHARECAYELGRARTYAYGDTRLFIYDGGFNGAVSITVCRGCDGTEH